MKKIIYLFIMLISMLITTQSVSAQKDSSGIYKTAEDFQQRKLSYAINCKNEKHKINPNILFNGSEVKVKHEGVTYNLKKSEVFAYRTCEGVEYRFVDDKEYKVLNPGETLIMYMYQHPAHSGKDLSKGLYKPEYYFSNGTSASLQTLTKANIKALYPANHKFHDALDAQFKDDTELYAYDNFHKMYKLNWVIKNTVK